MSAMAAIEPEVLRPLLRSLVYEVLAVGFAYPEEAAVERLHDLLAREQDPTAGAGLPAGLLDGLRRCLAEVDRTDLESCHNALFSGNVACSAHETEYVADPFAKVRQMADVSGFYRAFGLEVSGARMTMPDFIATELEFMSLLCRKEALASDRGWADRVTVAVEAQRDFLRDHLGRWVATFREGILREANEADPAAVFYARLADLCALFVGSDVAVLGVSPLPLEERRMAGGAHAEPAECGAGPAAEPDP